MSDGYQGLPKSNKWGCFVVGILGVPVFLFLLGLDALGDCAPELGCRKGFLSLVLLPSMAITGAVFWSARAFLRSRSKDR